MIIAEAIAHGVGDGRLTADQRWVDRRPEREYTGMLGWILIGIPQEPSGKLGGIPVIRILMGVAGDENRLIKIVDQVDLLNFGVGQKLGVVNT